MHYVYDNRLSVFRQKVKQLFSQIVGVKVFGGEIYEKQLCLFDFKHFHLEPK